jgi:hypothetical protein
MNHKTIPIFCLLILSYVFSKGQKATYLNFDSLKNKPLLFKEVSFGSITRGYCDTTIAYYEMRIDKRGASSDIDLTMNSGDSKDENGLTFIAFQLYKSRDSIYLSYEDPIEHKVVKRCQYPLNRRDTIEDVKGFRSYVDSSYHKVNDTTYYIKRWLEDNNDTYDKTTYRGDTTIIRAGHKFDCYVIQQIHFPEIDGDLMKNILLIDKACLFPLEEDEYRFHQHGWTCLNMPRNKWTLVRLFKLIGIE